MMSTVTSSRLDWISVYII